MFNLQTIRIEQFPKSILARVYGDLANVRSPLCGEFDFLKGQTPTDSPCKPGKEGGGGGGGGGV